MRDETRARQLVSAHQKYSRVRFDHEQSPECINIFETQQGIGFFQRAKSKNGFCPRSSTPSLSCCPSQALREAGHKGTSFYRHSRESLSERSLDTSLSHAEE